MNINREVFVTPQNENRFQNFIVFEPSSFRISDNDILIKGYEIQERYDQIVSQLMQSNDIKSQIISNRLTKIGQMLDLLNNYDNLIISKFFDRIWRRYSYISNLGETFLDIRTFLTFFPEYEKNLDSIVSKRIDESNSNSFEDDDSNTENSKKNNDNTENNNDTEETTKNKTTENETAEKEKEQVQT
jgi:hypothetical protein